MDDRQLILFVQQYEELYNFKNPNYNNLQRRENIWEEIGQSMKQPGHMCRERWKRLRDNHRKALRLRQAKSGQGASKIKAPKFEKELTFLVPYICDEEIRESKIYSPSNLTQDEKSSDNMDSHGTVDNNDAAHSKLLMLFDNQRPAVK
ncbi:hypothetical protein Cfor_07624 [Coptotermes formosanus]|uniref:MADF domain-containing protein n=1 Tax=Coptotermes formosanus TaxID=36987 RepID=A0A6L2PL03_COPFO|nr:hypothetical protein Cfor_07624 [Coptotermes formosanus]